MMVCDCCATEITAPVFIDGKKYGWSCARKIHPEGKFTKPKDKYVAVRGTLERQHGTHSMVSFVAKLTNSAKKLRLLADNAQLVDGVWYVQERYLMVNKKTYVPV